MKTTEQSNQWNRMTLEDLERNPELAIDVLRHSMTSCLSRELLADPHWRKSSLELHENWIGAQRAIPLAEAKRLMEATTDFEEYDRIQRWAGRRGRPMILRHTAIMALVRKRYFKETWRQVTKRLCQCGKLHTPAQLATKCQPKLEAEVRILKRLLKDCKVELPEEL